MGPGEMVRWLRTLVALAKNLGSVLSTDMGAHNQVTSVSSSGLKGTRHTQGVHM